MNEAQFEERADRALDSLERALESSGAACDCERKSEGMLELGFDNGSKIIVNRHQAAHEIWVAAKSGGYHFRFDGARWVDTRVGEELFAALSRCISEQAGEPVSLQPGPST